MALITSGCNFLHSSQSHFSQLVEPTIKNITRAFGLSIVRKNLRIDSEKPKKLKKQPVPPLNKTLSNYLRSVKPLLNDAEFNRTKALVKEFGCKNGCGEQLQCLLEERAKTTKNWLSDYWLYAAYLNYGMPVVVHSSPGTVLPIQSFIDTDDYLLCAAKVVLGALDFKCLIDTDQIKQERMGKDLLDMRQYKMIYGTSRIPGEKSDGQTFHPKSKHIVIVSNNQYFKVTVLNDEDQPLNIMKIKELICEVILQSMENSSMPIGLLTSERRNVWAKYYEELKDDPANKQALEAIEESLFLLCLDKPLPDTGDNRESIIAAQSLHGGGADLNSANRWFDKCIQFFMDESGALGITYEHSPAEGGPVAVMTQHVLDFIKDFSEEETSNNNLSDMKPVERLTFNISSDILYGIAQAARNVNKLAENVEVRVFKFDEFGKKCIKWHKLSPDSFIQMAFQYTFYKMYRQPAAQYESASCRKYSQGRTECIRSCTEESVRFAQMMVNPNCTPEETVKALREAVQIHKKNAADAVNGYGVDRHLLGLRCVAIENDIELPEFFSDAGFLKSSHFRITSSQVPFQSDAVMCFGPVVPNGYGCCYNPRENDIMFAITAFNNCTETSAARFSNALAESLSDMNQILLKVPPPVGQSKK